MGQHTWFYKDRALFLERKKLYDKCDRHESGEEFLSDEELTEIESQLEEIDENNNAEFHDCFRTSKRNVDGTYTDDIILSKKECYQWLEDNKDKVHDLRKDNLKRFWDKYPDGAIDFG